MLLAGNKAERGRVDAMAQAGRLRAIVKDVAEVSVAACAEQLGTVTEEAEILFGRDIFLCNGPGKTWPAGSRIEFIC
jgi:hypothetical protein